MAVSTSSKKTIVPIYIGNVQVRAEVTPLGGRTKVGALRALRFSEFTETLESLSEALIGSLEKCAPQKATVELGLEIGIESGKLTALLVKGTGTANFKVTLEWDRTSAADRR